MIKITKIVELCGACPSSWEGWDKDGAYYYYFHRWGSLRIDRAPTEADWQSPIALAFGAPPNGKNETIYDEQINDELDGFMKYETLRNRVRDFMILPESYSYYDQGEEVPAS